MKARGFANRGPPEKVGFSVLWVLIQHWEVGLRLTMETWNNSSPLGPSVLICFVCCGYCLNGKYLDKFSKKILFIF